MAVLFPMPNSSYTLNPAKSAEMLQGFLNIEADEKVTNGELTKANLQDYKQKHATPGPNTAVANYLSNNFDFISQLGNPDNKINVNDLVRLRPPLPFIPPVTNGGSGNNGGTGRPSPFPIFIPYPVYNQGVGSYPGYRNPFNPFGGFGSANNGFGNTNTGFGGSNTPPIMFLLFSRMMQLFGAGN